MPHPTSKATKSCADRSTICTAASGLAGVLAAGRTIKKYEGTIASARQTGRGGEENMVVIMIDGTRLVLDSKRRPAPPTAENVQKHMHASLPRY